MSNYLREVLGAEKTFLNPNQPQGLVADIGPDIPGGEGANEGFWREQIRDRLGQFAKMFGNVLFDIEIEGLGRITGHGEIVEMVRPQVALVRVKNHKVLPDGDYEIPGEDLEGIDGLIKDADYERVTGKTLPKSESPELKDEITGDEAMQVVRNAGAEYAKSQGRFPMSRTYDDVRQGLRAQYMQFLDGIKKDNPELLKNQFIINEDGTGRVGDIETEDDFWGAITAMQVSTTSRWVSPDNINPLAKEVNRRYAEKFLGVKKDGLISFYRNAIQEKDDPADAAAGYISLDKKMAWDYNPTPRPGDVTRGRYIVKAKPDEVLGILGYSGALDEFGVVISPEVTSLPGRFERVGDLEKQTIDTAPWVEMKLLDEWIRTGGGGPFRFLAPMTNFDYYALDSNPFGEESTWASFIKTNNLPDKSVSQKYDEIYGAGSWEKDWKGSNPTARVYADLFVKFTDKDGKEKWGLNAPNLRNLSTTDMLNFAEPGDDFDRGIKLLSTMQELMGKPFFVNKGHDQSDPRIPDEPTQINNLPAELDKKEFKGSELLDSAIKNNEINYDALPESTLTASFDRKDIPKEQDEAISVYSGSEFLDINAYLRADEVSILTNKDYLDKNISNIDALIDEKGDVLEETKVYRGTNSMVDSGTHRMLDALQEGDIVEDPAYSSTTKNSKIAFSNFGLYSKIYDSDSMQRKVDAKTKNGGNSSFWVITLPVGSKALAKPEGQYPHSHEKEILLPRGSKYKINGIRKIAQIDENGNETGSFNYFIDATVQLESAEVIKDTPNTTNLKSEPSLDLSNFEKVSDRLGSNPGGIYKDPKTDKQYYVKIQDEDRGNNERLASAIYKEADLGSLEVKDGSLDGKPITYTEWKEGLTPLFGPKANDLGYSKRQEALDSAKDGYLIDAWIANWDIVGEGLDNISTDEDSNPVRLDAGGALLYRARGSRKGSAFGNEVVELETFKDSSNTAELMYGNMYLFPRAERNSYEKLKAISPDRIDQLVDQYISNPDDNKELKDKLKARRQFILDKYENSYLLTGSESKLYGSKTTQNISKEDKKAVNNYTNAGHRYINKYLRDPENPEYQKSKESAEKLNNIIKDNTLIEDTTLLRVTRNFDEDYQPGDIIEDAGIQSTTKVGRSAIHSTVMDKLYPEDPESVEFVGYTTYTIKAPAGTPALDVTDMSQFRSEGEVLLPAGTKFKVISYERKPVSEFGGSYRNITVEVVSGEESEKTGTNDPFDDVEWFEEEQPVSASKLLDGLVKDGIVDLDAVPDSTILSKFTVDDIPEDQRRSLSTYSGSDYQVINNLLRFGPESAYTPTENINKLVKNLDDLIESKGTVESDSVVFRGMIETERYEDSDVLMSEMLDGLKPGDVISDPAFLSTSSDKNVALRRFGPGNMTDEGSKLDASNPVYQSSSFWVIKVPEGSKAFATPEKGFGYASVEKEVILPRNTQLRIDGIKKVAQEEEGGENGEFNYYIEASVVPVSKNADWDPLTGLETSAEKKERIEPGFENWNNEVEKIFEDWDNDLIVGVEIYDAGNILQANFIKKAGFNEKPKVLSQEEFDAIEAETVYRGHQSNAFMNNYKDSELQFAGEGYFGNGTYTSNKRDTAENYAGSSGPDPSTQAEIDERILEMKMLPDANVLSFEEVTDLREWADQKTREFLESYEKSGANPAQYQEAEWRLFNESDYTNIAIMLGIDAIRFKVPLTDKEEYYTIILNRGKVAINGKS